jgi:uncharacterized Fe-S cluster-containing protein
VEFTTSDNSLTVIIKTPDNFITQEVEFIVEKCPEGCIIKPRNIGGDIYSFNRILDNFEAQILHRLV